MSPRRSCDRLPGRDARGDPATGRLDQPERAERGVHRGRRRRLERQERRPDHVGLEQAHRHEGGLRRDRVGAAAEVGEEERQPALVGPPCGLPVARPGRRAQRDQLARDLVGRDRHDAVAAHRQDRQRPGVVAGEDRDVARALAADAGDLLEVAAGLLDRDDARVLGQPQERVGVDVRARPRRDVVDDDRQVALVGDRPEVRVEHPAVGPVVVRRDDQRGVGTELGRPAGRPDRGGGVVGAGPGDDPDAVARRPLGDDLDGRGDEPLALVGGQGGGFAGRAARDEAVDAGQDLPADEPAEGGLVEVAVGGERGDEGGEGAAEHRVGWRESRWSSVGPFRQRWGRER